MLLIHIPNGAHNTTPPLPQDHRLDSRICVVLNRSVTAHLHNLVSCASIMTGLTMPLWANLRRRTKLRPRNGSRI